MGYKNFSEICPIFNTDNNSGLEHEMIAPIQLSCTTTSYPSFQWTPGREVVLQEAYLVAQNSTGLTTALSCTLQIASDASSSTVIGSIDCGSAVMTDYLGAVLLSGSITSTALTSTDVVSIWGISGAGACKAVGNSVILRYRDK
jgi:hypothetical protein